MRREVFHFCCFQNKFSIGSTALNPLNPLPTSLVATNLSKNYSLWKAFHLSLYLSIYHPSTYLSKCTCGFLCKALSIHLFIDTDLEVHTSSASLQLYLSINKSFYWSKQFFFFFCKNRREGSLRHGAAETNLTRNHEVVGLTPGLAQ